MWKDTLATAVRGKQVTLGILFACIVIGTAILGYVWAQTDDQIDRGSKIGISVAFGSIIGANFIGLVVTAASRIFSLQTASVGYRYPASLRYLLYALSITLAAFSALLVSSSNITDKSLQTGLVVTTGLLAVFTGFLGLYFHSSLLPIDFEALDDYSQKEGLPQFFPRSLLYSENFSSAVASSDLPQELQDILLRAAQKKDYLGVLDTLQRLPFSEVKTFKALLEAPEMPYAPPKTLAQVITQRSAEDSAGPEGPSGSSYSERFANLFKRRPSDPVVMTEAPSLEELDIPAQPKVRRPSFSEQVSNIASSVRKTLGETKRAVARPIDNFASNVASVASNVGETLGTAKRRLSGTFEPVVRAVRQKLDTFDPNAAVVRNAQALARDTIPSKRPLPPTLLPGTELPASSLLKPRLATG